MNPESSPLKSVRVTKADSCLTYVLKRRGIISKYNSAKDIPADCFGSFNLETAEVGQIVVWKSKKSHYLYGTEICTIKGRPAIIHNNEFAGFHFGVIELIENVNNQRVITISDCVRNENNQSFPEITLSTITNCETPKSTEVRVPELILHYNKIEDE